MIVFTLWIFLGSVVTGAGVAGIESPVSSDYPPGQHTSPAISGDLIIWRGTDPVNFTSKILLYNLSSGKEEVIVAASNDFENLVPPWISGEFAAWQETDSNWMYRIHVQDLARRIPIPVPAATDGTEQKEPVIENGCLVYQEKDTINGTESIVLYNISSNITLILSPGQCDTEKEFPAISGDIAAWYEHDMVNYTISLTIHDLLTGNNTVIPLQSSEMPFSRPSISGDRVVFEDNYGITLYNVTLGEYLPVPRDDTDILFNPSISGDRIVYANRSGPHASVWLYDLSTHSCQQLVPGGDFDMLKPMIGGNRVVWEDWRSGNQAIRMFTIGSTATLPEVNFTANETYGPTPLTVMFNDTTSGSPSTWDWDFGDGSRSSDRNPVHTYLANGSFTVHLAVSAPDCRGFLTRESYITAGSPPEIGFSGTPVSGITPLTVQFTAESSGGPMDWSWDFGDGSHSTDQSPVHTYTVPGWYSVRLTGSNEFGNTTVTRDSCIAALSRDSELSFGETGGAEFGEGGDTLHLNTSLCNYSFNASSPSTLTIFRPEGSFPSSVELISGDPEGFILSGDLISGNISRVLASTGRIGLSGAGSGTFSPVVNLDANLSAYPVNASLIVGSISGAPESDRNAFADGIMANNLILSDIGYEFRVLHGAIPPASARIMFAANSSWVRLYSSYSVDSSPSGALVLLDDQFIGTTPITIHPTPGSHKLTFRMNGRVDNTFYVDAVNESIRLVRMNENGTVSMLDTMFAGYDEPNGSYKFLAESPEGMSTFGVVAVHGSGNIPQFIYLALTGGGGSDHSSTYSGSGGGSGGGSSGGGAGASAASQATVIPTGTGAVSTQAPEQVLTVQPTNLPVTSENRETASATGTIPGAAPNPKVAAVTPGSSIFTTLIQVIAIFAVVAITAVALYSRWRRGGIG